MFLGNLLHSYRWLIQLAFGLPMISVCKCITWSIWWEFCRSKTFRGFLSELVCFLLVALGAIDETFCLLWEPCIRSRILDLTFLLWYLPKPQFPTAVLISWFILSFCLFLLTLDYCPQFPTVIHMAGMKGGESEKLHQLKCKQQCFEDCLM